MGALPLSSIIYYTDKLKRGLKNFMKSLIFLKEYITKPRTVGAVLPSSKYLADKMVANIDFDRARCIVEYGPGTGVFTDKILKLRRADTVLILIENNAEFYGQLKNKYRAEANLSIINDSAEHVCKYLPEYGAADYIVSGLPFASLPPEVSSNILQETQKCLKHGGKFITFQYTLLKRDFIGGYFRDIEIKRELRNVPPAYVLSCSNP